MNRSGSDRQTLIIGAGLAGLSAAYHLKTSYALFEKDSEIGGMARSAQKDGYIFDYDGHLLHFRNEYAFNLVSELLNGNMAPHKRNSWIYSKGAFTRYPFQANFYGLPKSVVKDCLMGLIKARIPFTQPSPHRGLLRNTIFCHSRESGNPERFNFNRLIDTRFHGYDGFNLFRNSPHIHRHLGSNSHRVIAKHEFLEH